MIEHETHDHQQRTQFDGIGGEASPPILVPTGMNPVLAHTWVTFLRTVGDAMREDEKSRESHQRVEAVMRSLVPNDDVVIGRAEPDNQIVWIRPADEHPRTNRPGRSFRSMTHRSCGCWPRGCRCWSRCG